MPLNEFIKMEALGNDFVVIDARSNSMNLTPKIIRKIANRKLGIGCDQILMVETSKQADAKIVIYNADGSRAEMCGNGMRAVGLYLYENKLLNLETDAGIIEVSINKTILVSMGPKRDVKEIQLNEEISYHVILGNPHTVFFRESLKNINLTELGPRIENSSIFPNRTNVEFAQLLSSYKLELRIWERGVGETNACGSGACAAALSYWYKYKIEPKQTEVVMPGGSLFISLKNGILVQEGPANFVFKGSFYSQFFN